MKLFREIYNFSKLTYSTFEHPSATGIDMTRCYYAYSIVSFVAGAIALKGL